MVIDDPAANDWCNLSWTQWQPSAAHFVRAVTSSASADGPDRRAHAHMLRTGCGNAYPRPRAETFHGRFFKQPAQPRRSTQIEALKQALQVPLWEWSLPDKGSIGARDLMCDTAFVWYDKFQRSALIGRSFQAIGRIMPRTGA
jgi:hypothetical protein